MTRDLRLRELDNRSSGLGATRPTTGCLCDSEEALSKSPGGTFPPRSALHKHVRCASPSTAVTTGRSSESSLTAACLIAPTRVRLLLSTSLDRKSALVPDLRPMSLDQ
ncbi:hypothetical protein VTN00DRAFT_5989 [Thermoascus crustaceus]|uniref:uncharacterized protein n=1 Tax=Thermoascus crustaceus TaxID=5088 RepID=UPI003742C588